MAVVTISRLLGSEGDEIALMVAESLGYDLIDTGLIIEVAKRAGVSVEDARHYDEKYQSRAVEWLKGFISPRMGKILAGEEKHLDPKSFIEYAKTIILGLAEKGKMVIVGRAGQFILQQDDCTFHVRIIADEKFRVERIKKRHGISESDALEMIKKSDNMRKNYIERYFHGNWSDPQVYNLILNTSKLGIDEAAKIIIDAIERFSSTHEYIPGVRDRRKSIRRSGKERRKGDRRFGEDIWSYKETQRSVLKGRPTRSLAKTDRRTIERRKKERRADSD